MTGVDGRHGDAPWWASGADDLDDHADPFEAHRRARSGDRPRPDGGHGGHDEPGGGAGGGWEEPDAATHDRVVRSSLEDALEVLAAIVRAAARRAGRTEGATREAAGRQPTEQVHDPACRGCPWCTIVRAFGDSRPEVTEHLEQAARHVVLAARAWVDAAEHRTGWERIPLDDDEEQQ